MVSKLEDAVSNIAKSGFKIGEAQAYKNRININEPEKEVGICIYCSHRPEVLEKYANYPKSPIPIFNLQFMNYNLIF